jgi:hypothetical protein
MIKRHLLKKIGLHPFVALTLILVDLMLFGSDIMIITWWISAMVGIMLIAPSILLQRFAYKDEWAVAIAKGIIVGILTGIPTPLPAVVTGIGGVLGLIGSRENEHELKP